MKIYVSKKEKIKKIVHMEYQQKTMPTHLFNYGTEDVEIQNLEQHDKEIRKQERQKVIAEVEEWVDKSHTINITEHEKDNSYEEYKTVDFAELKQKLNEMKGEIK